MAKLPLLYVKLCLGIGYFSGGVFQKGSVTTAPTPELIAEYTTLLHEFETIAEVEGVQRLANNEGVDVPIKIAKWREMLTEMLVKR